MGTTLEDLMEAVGPERRKKIEARARELIAGELSLREPQDGGNEKMIGQSVSLIYSRPKFAQFRLPGMFLIAASIRAPAFLPLREPAMTFSAASRAISTVSARI